MLNTRFAILLVSILTLCILLPASAVNADTELMLLVDASSSMSAPGSGGTQTTKFRELTGALTSFLQALPGDVAIGLRVVGGTQVADCYYSYRYFIPTQGIKSNIQDEIENIVPGGDRGLYQGIQDGLDDLLESRTRTDKVLLVITDGGDDCDQDFNLLSGQYAYRSNLVRVIIFGLDLPTSVKEELGTFAGEMEGRLLLFDDVQNLGLSLVGFAGEFANNLRIYLQDTTGQAVSGDLIIKNVNTNQTVTEMLDVNTFSTNVLPGTYQVTGRYLGQEVVSERFAIGENESRSISITFPIYREPISVNLKDAFGNSIRARLTFFNSSDDPILTTEFDSTHYVSLPPGTYYVEARVGDSIQTIYGINVGEGEEDVLNLELPVEMGVLEVEVNNYDGIPVNSSITIFDQDGTVVDEAEYSSYLYSRLPAGTYRVLVDTGTDTYEDTTYLYEGDQLQMGFDVDVPVGSIFVTLKTESGYDVWGIVKIYDDNGNLLERFFEEDWESPDWLISDIPVGVYRIEAEADNVVRVVSGVEVTAGEEVVIEIVFPDDVF